MVEANNRPLMKTTVIMTVVARVNFRSRITVEFDPVTDHHVEFHATKRSSQHVPTQIANQKGTVVLYFRTGTEPKALIIRHSSHGRPSEHERQSVSTQHNIR